MFQSSFELTGYITRLNANADPNLSDKFQSSFELTGYITVAKTPTGIKIATFQSSFELTGYITAYLILNQAQILHRFKALSSLRVI